MKKNIILKIVLITIVFSFGINIFNVSFAKNKKYKYNGYEADGPWDAFYNYFMANWGSKEGQEKLTTDELKRFVAGPTDEEEDLAAEGAGPTVRPAESGIVSDVTDLVETRKASGNDSQGLDKSEWEKKKKEALEIYNKITAEKDESKRKKLYQQYIDKVEEMKKIDSKSTTTDMDINTKYAEAKREVNQNKSDDSKTDSSDIYQNQVSESDIKKEASKKNDTIYKQPARNETDSSADTLDDMIGDADSFVKTFGRVDKIDNNELADLSGTIYNIALQIGVAVAVLVGMALGIKFMMSGVDERADVKKALTVYIVGCVVIFGAFGIWKLVVEIMQNI